MRGPYPCEEHICRCGKSKAEQMFKVATPITFPTVMCSGRLVFLAHPAIPWATCELLDLVSVRMSIRFLTHDVYYEGDATRMNECKPMNLARVLDL